MGTALNRETNVPSRWPQIALWLVAGTMAYNVLEAAIALWAGAAADSIVLLGFGFDSVIETAAAGHDAVAPFAGGA